MALSVSAPLCHLGYRAAILCDGRGVKLSESLTASIDELLSRFLPPFALSDDVNDTKVPLTRRERLVALGTTYLCDARTGALSKAGVVGAAFDAGYLALLAAVPDESARAGINHPSAAMASKGCHLLGVSGPDIKMALSLVEAYYDGTLGSFDIAETSAWAERMRSAVLPI
jgi:hypothetical protein